MLNEIYFNNKLIKDKIKVGRCRLFIMEDSSQVKNKELLNNEIKIKCHNCCIFKELKFYNGLLNKKYLCSSCSKIGNLNPFYGKKHKKETLQKISCVNKGNKYWLGKKHTVETKNKLSEYFKGKMCGNLNPFYGKLHTKESLDKISEANIKWRNSLTKEQKLEISKKISESQKLLQKKDPEGYKKMKAKGGLASSRKIKYKMNKIEKIVEQELKNRNLNFKYSVIFCNKQFDFGNKENKILLEVQGDYWHANPNKYKKLNKVQSKNIKNDCLKRDLAKKYGFKLFLIWEHDILQNNFLVLDEIKEFLNV